MSLEGSGSHALQQQPLHASLSPAAFYSASPRPTMVPASHRPSLLRNASTPGPPDATTPVSPSTFSVVMGKPPVRDLASNTLGNPPTAVKKRGRPPGSFKNSQGTTPPTQLMRKKRGRPFKNPDAAAAAAAAAAADSDHIPKKRGRPVKYAQDPGQVKTVVPPEPKFVPFICEWKKCPAELHNLDTLRAHLDTVHLKKQPPRGPYVCLWRKCCQEHEIVDAEAETSNFIVEGVEFKTKDEWRNHIKVVHLDSVAWHQGDGPKVALNFGKKPQPDTSLSYLYDEDGRQVTPSVKNQPIEYGHAKVNNAARFEKQREGLYVVLVPVKDPKVYMKVEYGNEDDDADDDAGDEMDMDKT